MFKKTASKEDIIPANLSVKTFKSLLSKRHRALLNDQVKIITSQTHSTCKLYFIGGTFPDVYFTTREAECMALLLKGKSIKDTSIVLGISLRTVESYVKNMRIKLGCRNKHHLIETVFTTAFPKVAEKIYLRLMLNFSEYLASHQ